MAQKNEEVIVLDVADNQTILAGDPIKVVSGYATKDETSFSGNTMGIALTDATFTTAAAEGVRKKLGVLTTGKFDFTGLVENDNTGTYTSNITAGIPVGFYWSGGTAYVVNNTSNPIGTAQASLTGNENTTKEKEGVGTIAGTGLALDNVPITNTIHIEVPEKVFTVTEDAGSAATGVCDVTLSTKALIFNSNDTTSYLGQQVYAKYDYDANSDTTGSMEVRLSFLPKQSVTSLEIAPGAVGVADLDSTASYTMGGLTINNSTASAVTIANNLSVSGTIAGNILDTTYGNLTMTSGTFTGAGTSVLVDNNLSVGGNITGNISDTTFGDLTIATADFTGAGNAIEVTNNISAGGTVVGSNLNVTDWDNVNTVVNTNSASWESAESTLNTNSGSWLLNNANDTTSGSLSIASLKIAGTEVIQSNGDIIHPQTSTTGSGLSISRDLTSESSDSAVASFVQNNASDDQAAVKLQQDGPITVSGGSPLLAITCNSSNTAGSIGGYVPITVNGINYRMPFYDVS